MKKAISLVLALVLCLGLLCVPALAVEQSLLPGSISYDFESQTVGELVDLTVVSENGGEGMFTLRILQAFDQIKAGSKLTVKNTCADANCIVGVTCVPLAPEFHEYDIPRRLYI